VTDLDLFLFVDFLAACQIAQIQFRPEQPGSFDSLVLNLKNTVTPGRIVVHYGGTGRPISFTHLHQVQSFRLVLHNVLA
jgi:hypothetical protein